MLYPNNVTGFGGEIFIVQEQIFELPVTDSSIFKLYEL